MTGGTMAMLFAMLFMIFIVAVIALLIFFMVKYAAWIVPTYLIGTIIGKITEKGHKRSRRK